MIMRNEGIIEDFYEFTEYTTTLKPKEYIVGYYLNGLIFIFDYNLTGYY